jgi:hypothetical protein
MSIRRPGLLRVCGLAALLFLGAKRPKEHVIAEDQKTATDGVTTGWVLTYDNPDPDRAWERVPGTLVIAQHGRVIRRWEITTIRSWGFWNNGREVVYEEGGLHGPTMCVLASIKTGKPIAESENCGDNGQPAPAWVKAVRP